MATLIQSEGCQGERVCYYRAERWDNEGQCILATGLTDQEAERLADERLKERNGFIAMTPVERFRMILERGDMSQRDMEVAIRLIGRILGVKK